MATEIDVTIAPVKHASLDPGRKMKFFDDALGATPAVVKDVSGNTLEQPIKIPANGHLTLRFDQWPIYFSDSRQGWKRIKRLPGGPQIDPQAHIADLAGGADAATIVTKVNALLAALEADGILASS